MRVTAQKLLLFLFLPYYSYSQYEVIGVVKDSTNNPIEFANVVLTNELNKIVVGTITNKDGQFKLSTRKGSKRYAEPHGNILGRLRQLIDEETK